MFFYNFEGINLYKYLFMKKLILKASALAVAFIFTAGSLCAQGNEKKIDLKTEGYQFKDVVRLPTTDVKNQYRSGTCGSFSGLSYVESEMMRIKKNEDVPDLSEMFIVNKCYTNKAERFVRMHGKTNFGGGGAFHDVMFVLKNYGIYPEEEYRGLEYGTENHVHGEMDELLSNYVEGIVKNKNKKLSPVWKKGFQNQVNTYLGEPAKDFKYKGKTYTSQTFMKDVVGINPDDYVEITSYTHHPFYSTFVLEIPDNWLWNSVYNVPLPEITEIIDHALKNGYSIGWASDVSHKGFAYNKGVAVIPDVVIENTAGMEKDKWETLTEKEKSSLIYDIAKPGKEMKITQEMRQLVFDNYETTDDHGMHIVGIAKDQNGKEYYIVKNSWSKKGIYGGYFYASKAFIELQTTNFMIHKDGIPKNIRGKLKI